MEYNKLLTKEFTAKIAKDNKVVAVLLYGSYARGEKNRDIDICIVLDKKYSNLEMSKKRLAYSQLLNSKFDVHIFQQLPVYIRQRVLKDGKILLCNKMPLLYDIAFSTIKEFEMYKKGYYYYLEHMQK